MSKAKKKEHYFVYSDSFLGVKTNTSKFKWIYGSVAPEKEKSAFEKC